MAVLQPHINTFSQHQLPSCSKNQCAVFTAARNPIRLWTVAGFDSWDLRKALSLSVRSSTDILVWWMAAEEIPVMTTHQSPFAQLLREFFSFFFFLIILHYHADWAPFVICTVIALCTEWCRERVSSGGAGSQPPTGALCMKSVGFRTLSSHTSEGDSINYISQRALQHSTRRQTHRDKERERKKERERGREGERERGRGTTRRGRWDCDNNLGDETGGRKEWHRIKGRGYGGERRPGEGQAAASETYNNADVIFRRAGDRWGLSCEGDHC